MGLTGDQARQTREIAWEVADTIAKRIEESMDKAIRLHQAECPIKVEVEAKVNQAKGAKWAAGIVAAIVSFLIGAGGAVIGWITGK